MSDLTAERFERKLSEEISGLRLEFHDSVASQRDELRREMHEGFTTIRQEMHEGLTAVRQEMHDGFTAIRQEMHAGDDALRSEMYGGFSALRRDIASARTELLRWSFAFWVGQLAAIAGLLALMLRGTGR